MQKILKQARQHHRAGRLTEAERLYRRILRKQPRNAGALNLLGALAGQTAKFDEGVGLIWRAIAIKEKVAGYHTNLGNLLLRDGGSGGRRPPGAPSGAPR